MAGCGGEAFELTPGGVPEEDALECTPGGGSEPEAFELTPGVEAVGSGGEPPPRSELAEAGSRGGRGFVHNSAPLGRLTRTLMKADGETLSGGE